jgi:hypothetical protein
MSVDGQRILINVRPVNAILQALIRAMRRDLGSFAALKVNNFFLFVLFLTYSNVLYRLPPHSAYPFLLLVGFLLLFQMSSDPLAKIPAVRFGLWPLDASQRLVLRLASTATSPVFWIALILLLLTQPSLALAFVALAIAMQAAIMSAGSPRWHSGVRLSFPGKIGPLIAAAIRQMLSLLDTYIALLLAITGCAYRFLFSAPDAAAYPIFALLIALALSTYAQCLFGLDSGSALTRYRLLPLPLWQIVLAKDIAYLAILIILVAPLSLAAGLTSGLVALAIGRQSSIRRRSLLYRWRFTGGRVMVGVPQAVLGIGLGLAAQRVSPAFLGIAAAAYCVSLLWLGLGISSRRSVTQ